MRERLTSLAENSDATLSIDAALSMQIHTV